MKLFSQDERVAALAQMERDGVDVFVIGGGITGVSVAMDAAARGYRVGLVEKADFASGTSSKSTKLIHGGLRYLPQFDFALVREALTERGLLFQNAPWIVKPLGFVLPLYQWNKRPLASPIVPPFGLGLDRVVQVGLLLYDLLAGKRNLRRHRRLSLTETGRDAPALKQDGLRHAFVYYDGQTDDARLTMTVLRTAHGLGAVTANYAEVTGFEITEGRIQAVHVRDTLTGRDYLVRARHVINAAGVFAQRIEELTGELSRLLIAPAKGVHLVFSRETLLMGDAAIVLPETEDGRLLFIIPWEGRVLVGTTDTAGGDIDDPATTEADVNYLLNTCSRYLKMPLKREDILGSFAAYRPLIARRDAGSVSSSRLSRSHAVLDGPAGMISIVGGKLTTWRRMGEDTMNHVARRDGGKPSTITRTLALDGSDGWTSVRDILETKPTGLDADIRAHLGAAYGANGRYVLALLEENSQWGQRLASHLPYILGEIVYTCRYEMALTLDDMLSRRLPLFVTDHTTRKNIACETAELMATELKWDADETRRQLNTYLEIVQIQYQIRAEKQTI